MSLLRKDETLTASCEIRASAAEVYAVVSDVTRIPQWSPETKRAEWVTADRFKAWNRRRLARWSTVADVVDTEPDRKFSFKVQVLGGDWTQWTYEIEPGSSSGTTRLTETFRMCVPLPVGIALYERFFLFVADRRSDLQDNLNMSVNRIRTIVEAESTR